MADDFPAALWGVSIGDEVWIDKAIFTGWARVHAIGLRARGARVKPCVEACAYVAPLDRDERFTIYDPSGIIKKEAPRG